MIRNSLRFHELLRSNAQWNYTACSQSTQVLEKLDDKTPPPLPYEKIPGPKALDLIFGFTPNGKYANLDVPDFVRKLQSEYGDIIKMPGILGKKDIVFVFHPSDFEKVFRVMGKWPVRNGMDTFVYYRKHVGPKVFAETGGLIAEQGEQWADVRHKVNPVMLMPKTVKLYVSPIDGIAREFTHKIREIRDAKNEVPSSFNELMCKWSLESISYIALNKRLGLLDDSNPSTDGKRLIKLINEFFTYSVQLDLEPSFWKYISTPTFRKQMKTIDELTQIIIRNVDEMADKYEKESVTRTDTEMSVLEKLLKIDRNVAIVMASDMMAAGIDTTSSMAVAVLYCLAKNPVKQEILREELKQILPEKDTPFTIENTTNMPYLRACMKEALRVQPVALGNFRETGEEVVLQGYTVPKGIDVSMFNSMPMNDEQEFAQPKEFIPERWLKTGNTTGCPSAKNAHPFAYMPFGFGARACIGKRYAELEVEMLVSRLVRNFKIEWNYPELKWKTTFLSVPDGPIRFQFTDIDN